MIRHILQKITEWLDDFFDDGPPKGYDCSYGWQKEEKNP